MTVVTHSLAKELRASSFQGFLMVHWLVTHEISAPWDAPDCLALSREWGNGLWRRLWGIV